MVKHYLHKHSAPSALRRVLLAAMLLLIGATASAHDFAVENADGVTIYYEKLNDGSVAVTYAGSTTGSAKYRGNVNIPSSVTFNGTSYSVTSIGHYAFKNCTGLTEVTIPESVTSIGQKAFENCTGLTEVTIPNSVTSIEWESFAECFSLTEVTIPESVTEIGRGAFYGCSRLTEVIFNASNCTKMGSSTDSTDPVFGRCYNLTKWTIGDNVQKIPAYTFSGCSGLTEVIIPESVTSIDKRAFYNSIIRAPNVYNKNLMFQETHTTISIKIDKVPNWNLSKEFYLKFNNNEYKLHDEEFIFDGLIPGTTYTSSVWVTINGIEFELTSYDTETTDVTISGDVSKTATSIILIPNVNSGDAVVDTQCWTDKNNGEPIYITGLDPNITFTYNYIVKGEGWTRKKEFTVKTDELTMLTLPGVAMNTTTALLCAETNICDDEVNVGFEWRRHDAPSTLPSSKVTCAAIDGTITGALSGLNPEVYYNYRPYYTSDSGKTYYGEWITFFTGDANVFFDPTVKTYSADVLDNYSAVLKGYALRGSEEIASQGFQYWKSWGAPNGSRSGSADGEIAEVEVKGQKLSCTISNLEPGSTYTYRTFVKTASGITYGEEMTFDTPEASDIEETVAEKAEVKITGYYNLQGVKSDRPFSGLNIVSYSDGTTKKIIYRK